jgi:hypothetical protein
LIKPFVLPPTMGWRDMDVSDPGQELPEAALGSLAGGRRADVRGCLRAGYAGVE